MTITVSCSRVLYEIAVRSRWFIGQFNLTPSTKAAKVWCRGAAEGGNAAWNVNLLVLLLLPIFERASSPSPSTSSSGIVIK